MKDWIKRTYWYGLNFKDQIFYVYMGRVYASDSLYSHQITTRLQEIIDDKLLHTLDLAQY